MEKNEHVIFLDVPMGRKNGRFHSAVLTTYAIDLIYFDHQLLNTLHRKQICSVNVLADFEQMNKSMDFISPNVMEKIGKEYSISNMNYGGAFHPKINFFVGDDAALVLMGTGNLTVTGQGKNHETFSGLWVDETDDKHRPLIEECWKYLTRFTNQCSPFERNRILHEIPDNCSFLDDSYLIKPHQFCDVQDNLKAALLYNDETSGILKQISTLIPLNNVNKVTIVSPFFDENGETLLTIADLCPNAKVDVILQKDCSLPPCNIPNHPRISFYDFDETLRGKMKFQQFDRKLHAKIFHFQLDSMEYCMIGSANATIAGLGTMKSRGINEELSILYSSEKKQFLSELGLTSRKKLSVDLKSMERSSSHENSSSLIKIRLLSAEYENKKLSISYCGNFPNDAKVVAYDGNEKLYIKPQIVSNDTLVADVMLGKGTLICYIEKSDGDYISNKVFVNVIEKLETTNPSQTSRSLNKFISLIENEGYNGLDVANILSDIMWDWSNDSEEPIKIQSGVKSDDATARKSTLPDIKYNAAYDNGDPHKSRIYFIDRTSRLIECIEESIRRKIRAINDAINDEEEEGSSETSNNRDVQESEDIIVKKNSIKIYSEQASSLLNRYMKMIDKRKEQINTTGINIITKDDLNFFSLCIFAAIEICSLNRSRYQFDVTNSIEKSSCQKQLFEKLDSCINSDGQKTLEKFTKFSILMRKPTPDDEDFEKKAKRTMKYVVLYGILFEKNATERDRKIHGPRIRDSIKQLISLFGLPSREYLISELMPISERYGFVFRESNIDRFIRNIK